MFLMIIDENPKTIVVGETPTTAMVNGAMYTKFTIEKRGGKVTDFKPKFTMTLPCGRIIHIAMITDGTEEVVIIDSLNTTIIDGDSFCSKLISLIKDMSYDTYIKPDIKERSLETILLTSLFEIEYFFKLITGGQITFLNQTVPLKNGGEISHNILHLYPDNQGIIPAGIDKLNAYYAVSNKPILTTLEELNAINNIH